MITVDSVGPYACTNRRPTDHLRATTSPTASAPTTIGPTCARSSGSNTSSNDGTTLAARTPTNSRNLPGCSR
ncbi:hypothetical protein SNL152K_10854 [Streptomyces sp. NL15-2K]|nr:hypothetical protein SNL152K_10854 [Streptomyces sp. NL15-2K]